MIILLFYHLFQQILVFSVFETGSVVADFADARDLDLVFNGQVSVEDAARCIADCVRHRRWRAPDPRNGVNRLAKNTNGLSFHVRLISA